MRNAVVETVGVGDFDRVALVEDQGTRAAGCQAAFLVLHTLGSAIAPVERLVVDVGQLNAGNAVRVLDGAVGIRPVQVRPVRAECRSPRSQASRSADRSPRGSPG